MNSILQSAQFWPIRTGTRTQGERDQECEIRTDGLSGPNQTSSEACDGKPRSGNQTGRELTSGGGALASLPRAILSELDMK